MGRNRRQAYRISRPDGSLALSCVCRPEYCCNLLSGGVTEVAQIYGREEEIRTGAEILDNPQWRTERIQTHRHVVYRRAYFVAIPEHRASVLRATRSPRRIMQAGPQTMAHWITGSNTAPSSISHLTLWLVNASSYFPGLGDLRAAQLFKNFVEKWHACKFPLVETLDYNL